MTCIFIILKYKDLFLIIVEQHIVRGFYVHVAIVLTICSVYGAK